MTMQYIICISDFVFYRLTEPNLTAFDVPTFNYSQNYLFTKKKSVNAKIINYNTYNIILGDIPTY